MKIFVKILLIVVPVALIVNLFRFTTNQNGDFEFFGLRALVLYIETFPGFQNTMNTIFDIQKAFIEINFSSNPLSAIADIGQLLYQVFKTPISAVQDILTNFVWIIGIFIQY